MPISSCKQNVLGNWILILSSQSKCKITLQKPNAKYIISWDV